MAGSGNMQDIKRHIRGITSIEHITNAMKLVSAAKLRRAKATFEKTQEYFHFVTESIQEIFNNNNDVPYKYLKHDQREIKKTGYVIITSNKGLAGSFNSNVIKKAEEVMKSETEDQCLVAIGGRGKDYFSRRGYDIVSEYMRPPESISFIETQNISQPIIDMYDEEKIDKVVLIYTSFISPLEQRVVAKTLLPFEIEQDPDIAPLEREVEYEPSTDEVFNYLVPKYVEIMVYNAIVESATCEHAARRIAMENATENAQEAIEELNLTFNRARQAAITSEITEIVSGADALE